jgi:type VI secretion system protein ImpH
MSFQAFERFLPGGLALRQLGAIVRSCVGHELECDLQLIVARDEVPGIRLGRGARLGWSSWVATNCRSRDADDVLITQHRMS